MKQGKLIRRAVSAALAGCMMFTLSAPALAESTDALMQLSIGSYRSSSLLSEENSFPTIKVNETVVTEENKDDILGGQNAGVLSYNEATKTLKSSGMIRGDLTIDAPGVNVELCNSTSGEAAVSGKLTVTNAQDVKVTAQSYVAVFGDVEISCDGKVEITSGGSPTVYGNVTVKRASTVAISGEWNGYHIVRGDVTIACPATVVIQNYGTGGMASSIVYSGGKYVYSDTENGTPVDPSSKPIDVNKNAVYITPKMYYTINSNDTAVIIKVDDTEAGKARPGQTIKAWAPNKEGYVFENWAATGVDLGNQVNKNWITFTMPDKDVTLTPNYKQYYTINSNDTAVIIKVDDVAADKALKGQTIKAWAPNKDGWEFEKWNATGIDLGNWVNKDWITFKMPESNVTLNPHYAKLHAIEVVNGRADIISAKEGTKVTVTADERPGYVFDRWEVNNGDVAVVNKNAEETTFVMPDEPVTAVAKYKKLLGITVNSGKAYVEDAVTDAALKGKPVVIKADEIEGKRFDHWEIVSKNVILDDLHASETKFTMPETAVEITALYNDLHAITVNNGTANVEEAVIGDTVKIKAESREGYVFDHWEVSYGDVAVANKNAKETTFTMPDSMVVLTARYKALQSITLENGKAYAGGEEITTAKKGTEVTIMADDLDGKVFDHWEIVSGNVTLENANKADTAFTMPAESISLKAVYNTIHSINTNEFCTADPASAIKGTEITVTAETREGYEFDGWAVPDGVELYDEDGLTAKFTMPDHDVTIEAKYKQYHSIEVSKGVATDAEGNPISSALEGTEIWIEIDREQRNPDEFEFKHWESGPEDLEIANRKAERTSFTMPDEDVTVEAKFLHLREITVHDGTTYVEGEEGGIAKAGQTVTVKADEIPGLKFDHWTVDSENVTLTTVDEATGEATFEMVNEPVELTAHYKAMVTVFSDPAKFSEDTGEESVTEWADVGEMATITAEIDEATFPGMVFDYWEIVTPADLKTENIESQTIEFKVPKSEVKLVAHWKSDALNPSTDPDAPLDPDFDVDPVDDGSGAAGAIVAGAALGGAAVWGGYEITTRVILNDLLPEGAAIPANRGQLALLVWNTAGRPEPAAQPAFADITDAEQAKAAQWCVEQGTMDAKGDCFEPEGWTPQFKVIEVWT